MSFYKDTARKNAHAYPRNFREITLEDEILENSVPGDLDTGRRYPYTAEQRSHFPIIFVNGRPTFKKMPDAPLAIPVRSTIPHQIMEVPLEIIFQEINYILRSRFGRDFEWTPPRMYYMTNIRKVRFMNELRIAAGLMRGIVKGPLTASVTDGKDEVCFAVSGNKDLLLSGYTCRPLEKEQSREHGYLLRFFESKNKFVLSLTFFKVSKALPGFYYDDPEANYPYDYKPDDNKSER